MQCEGHVYVLLQQKNKLPKPRGRRHGLFTPGVLRERGAVSASPDPFCHECKRKREQAEGEFRRQCLCLLPPCRCVRDCAAEHVVGAHGCYRFRTCRHRAGCLTDMFLLCAGTQKGDASFSEQMSKHFFSSRHNLENTFAIRRDLCMNVLSLCRRKTLSQTSGSVEDMLVNGMFPCVAVIKKQCKSTCYYKCSWFLNASWRCSCSSVGPRAESTSTRTKIVHRDLKPEAPVSSRECFSGEGRILVSSSC